MSFEKACEDFEKYVEKRHKKQGFITICTDLKNNVIPYFQGTNIEDLTKLDVLDWQDKILDKHFSNKYNSKIYYVFNKFLDFCVLYGYLEHNYLIEVGPFKKKIEEKNHVVYNIFQFLWFRFHVKDYVIKQFFNMMYFFGPRPGETTAFRFLDKKGRYIKVSHNMTQKGEKILETPKNTPSIRFIKLSLLMCFRIWRLKRYYIKKYGVFCNDYFIFGGVNSLHHTTIDRVKKKAYTRAKLPSITQHEFRHSYATRMIHKRKPIDKVSRSLGHSQVSTTLDVYLHEEKNTPSVLFHRV